MWKGCVGTETYFANSSPKVNRKDIVDSPISYVISLIKRVNILQFIRIRSKQSQKKVRSRSEFSMLCSFL